MSEEEKHTEEKTNTEEEKTSTEEEKHTEEKTNTEEKPHTEHQHKKVNKTNGELKFWKTAVAVLAILFVISIFTNGFKVGGNIETAESNAQLAQAGQDNQEVPSSSSGSSTYDTLAKCLTTKGAIMYGTEWCGYCKNQKEAFGDSMQYITFVDCDQDKNKCGQAGVRGYPTWVINGQNYPGVQEMDRLASLAGC